MLSEKNVNLYIEAKDIVSTFETVLVNNIDSISNGSISNMICHFIDKIPLSEKQNFLHVMLNKLAPGGKLRLAFVDFERFKIQLYRDQISQDEFNSMMQSINSLWTTEQILSFVKTLKNFVVAEYFVENNLTHIFIEKKKLV